MKNIKTILQMELKHLNNKILFWILDPRMIRDLKTYNFKYPNLNEFELDN